MGTIDIILCAFGALLIVTIVAVLIRIYYVIQQQGVQISILLKNEQALQNAAKEGYTPWMRYAKQRNSSANYDNNLLPEGKLLPRDGNPHKLVINNTRAMQPCHALSTDQMNKYASSSIDPQDGLAGHAEKAADLGISTEESIKQGNLNSVDFAQNSNYVSSENQPVTDQTGTVTDKAGTSETFKLAAASGNLRAVPAILNSMTGGVKQAHESSKKRFRLQHSGIRNY